MHACPSISLSLLLSTSLFLITESRLPSCCFRPRRVCVCALNAANKTKRKGEEVESRSLQPPLLVGGSVCHKDGCRRAGTLAAVSVRVFAPQEKKKKKKEQSERQAFKFKG